MVLNNKLIELIDRSVLSIYAIFLCYDQDFKQYSILIIFI